MNVKLRTTKELGVLIRETRRQAGLTQAQVANQMHATQKWVSAVENGKDTAEIGQVLRLLGLLRLEITVAPALDEAGVPSPHRRTPDSGTSKRDIRKPRKTTATQHPNAPSAPATPETASKPPRVDLDLDRLLDDMKRNKP